jgi:hypothetical protein
MRDTKRPRITARQTAEIQRLRAEGWGLRAVAETLGVSINSASRHGRRRSEIGNRRSPPTSDLRPPISGFIAPPSLARLMAGR